MQPNKLQAIEDKIKFYESMELPPVSYICENCEFAVKTQNGIVCRQEITSNCLYDNDSNRIQCQKYKDICHSWQDVRQKKLLELQTELTEERRLLNITKKEVFTPKEGEVYFYLDSDGNVVSVTWTGSDSDYFRLNVGNIFKTLEQAGEYKENLLTKQALRNLALELNNGIMIDLDEFVEKYSIVYYAPKLIELSRNFTQRNIGDICCLSSNFLAEAMKRIGKEKLIKLIESGV